jgi:patatin-related protein
MREKDLRLALVCYGGISLAVYMHGITKEIWHVARASEARHSGRSDLTGSAAVYQKLLALLERESGTRLKVLADIVAGASAGGINGIFLARAIATGQSLEPLTALWLNQADVEYLLDPDARPLSRFTKWWAVPIAWLVARRPGNVIDKTVEKSTRAEVRQKLSQLVRARWFEPPFGGAQFCNLLLKAFDAMAAAPAGPILVPPDHPIDLIVTVTDYYGHKERLVLNSPPDISEVEHRLSIGFRHAPSLSNTGAAEDFSDAIALTFAARATASFPGAFPPFTVQEIDQVLTKKRVSWPARGPFLARILPRQWAAGTAEDAVLLDGSVLANAPFRPAIAALRHRSARREVDRRFVYIDPKPDLRSISFGAADGGGKDAELPGFFRTIFGAMSDIPREQPIRENIDMLEGLSARIRRTRRVVDALQAEVDERVQALFGRTLFLDSPTAQRLGSWRAKAQARAAEDAGFAYPAYGHLKLSRVTEDVVTLCCRLLQLQDEASRSRFRSSVWDMLRQRGLDRISPSQRMLSRGGGAAAGVVDYFRAHDLGFRIRRLRLLARRVDMLIETAEAADLAPLEGFRKTVYAAMAPYLDRESEDYFGLDLPQPAGPAAMMDFVAARRDLPAVDAQVDTDLTAALLPLPKTARRTLLLAYLGFPFLDIATLALTQGDGTIEDDPVKIDRISPNDAHAIRTGGAAATLKGVQFNSFGAFFSAAYRENDYLWGRLHGADRLIDIIASATNLAGPLTEKQLHELKKQAFIAILDEEEPKLTRVQSLIVQLRAEIG